MIFTLLAGLLLFGVTGLALQVFLGNRKIGFLRDEASLGANFPRVSLVVAARNEEKAIESAVRTFLSQDYPNYEVCVVNDRSDDRTGVILDRLATEDPRLNVVTVRALPSGWIGKNHALWEGTRQTKGDLILFTDADVLMRPDAISRAIGFFVRHKLDHLALIPEVITKGVWLPAFVSYFTLMFASFYAPWRARDPKSDRYIGIGAFNLVRRTTYEKIGMHQAIRLRPDDDLKLGKLIKQSGAQQDCAFGLGIVSVEWYPDSWSLVKGLEKNTFAGLNYSVLDAVWGTAGILIFNVIPFLIWLGFTGWPALLIAISAILQVAMAIDNARFHGLPKFAPLLTPAAALLFIVIIWNAVLKTIWQGGIYWRGTFYSLNELRANKIAR